MYSMVAFLSGQLSNLSIKRLSPSFNSINLIDLDKILILPLCDSIKTSIKPLINTKSYMTLLRILKSIPLYYFIHIHPIFLNISRLSIYQQYVIINGVLSIVSSMSKYYTVLKERFYHTLKPYI